MATLLSRLGRTAYRRWPLFVAVWVVLLLALGTIAATMSKPMSDNFTIPGIPSERASELQAELFPGTTDVFDQATIQIVVAAPEGSTLEDAQYATAVDEIVAAIPDLPQVADDVVVASPVEAAQAQRDMILEAAAESGTPEDVAEADAAAVSPLSADGRVGLISFDLDVETPGAIEPATQDEVRSLLDDARDSGLQAEANGSGMQEFAPPSLASEALGIGVALIVLLLTFGSLVAAGMPILTAVIGVALSLMGVTAMTALVDINSTTPILATMIGLALGIDYTLFILARYRTELQHTENREQAVAIAVGTAGSAVVFAGLTVLIALAALSVVGIPFLTAMGVAAAVAVAVAVLVALTLLPALLGMLGRRTFAGTVRRYNPTRDDEGRILNNGVRWARTVGKSPVLAVVVVVAALGALAIPMKDLHLAFPTDSTASSDTTQRKAADIVADAFGPGRDAPMLVVVDARDAAEDARGEAFGTVLAWVAEQDGVENAQIAGANEEGTGAQLLVTPSAGAEDSATQDLLDDLREGQGAIEDETDTEVGVTGLTAITVDVSEQLDDALPVYLVVVIGLALILLVLVFRSLIIPLTAAFGFLLTVLATLGATVAVFQEGAFGWMEGQPIVSFMPIFLIGVVFGLAMDYQVFLVTRIREAHVHGMSTRDAVVDGFRNSARVVAAAAAIMISVFAAFMLQDDPIIRSMGFALAVAVAIDAFVVRMTLIPALMYLLDDKAWWMPRWLDRILPDVDVEGEKLDRPHLRPSDDLVGAAR